MARRVFLSLPAAATGIMVAFSAPPTALAQEAPPQPQCRPDREGAVEHLRKEYGEVPVAMALTGAGALLDVLASPGGGTWSILLTFPDGSQTCLISSGENWRPVAPVPAGERS